MVAGVADAQTAPGVPSGLQAVGGYERLVLSWYPPARGMVPLRPVYIG